MKPSLLSLSCLPTPKPPGVVRPSTCPRPQTAPDVQCASTASRQTLRWEKRGVGDLNLGSVQGQRARLQSLVLGLLRWERDGVKVDGGCSCKEEVESRKRWLAVVVPRAPDHTSKTQLLCVQQSTISPNLPVPVSAVRKRRNEAEAMGKVVWSRGVGKEGE